MEGFVSPGDQGKRRVRAQCREFVFWAASDEISTLFRKCFRVNN
jgi:hypothetical protein